MKRAYDQLPDEGSKPYAAFRLYSELGKDRSLAAVGVRLGKSGALIERWSSRHHWVNRAGAYDADEWERTRHEKAEEDRKERDLERRARRVMMQTARRPILRHIAALDKAYGDASAAADAPACDKITQKLERLVMALRTLNQESRAEWDEEPTQNVRDVPSLTVIGWSGNGDGTGN